MRQVRDLVVGEEPGEGGEGGHHPLEGDHRLLHVPVQEEDRGARESEYLHSSCLERVWTFVTSSRIVK